MFVYLAGPKPDSEDRRKRTEIAEELKAWGWSVFDPWGAWGGGARPGPAVAVVNLAAVDACAVLLARCPDNATGAAIEIGYALARGKRILLWRNGLQGAMFHHPDFTIVTTMGDVEKALRGHIHQQAAQGDQPRSE